MRPPRAGVINTRAVQTGQFVKPGHVLATLVDTQPAAPALQGGATRESLRARKPADGRRSAWPPWATREFHATVYHVSDVADPATRQVEVMAWVKNPGELKPGFFAEVTLASETRKGAAGGARGRHPGQREGLRGLRGRAGQGAACGRSRSACAPANGVVEILSGVKAGDVVVIEGSDRLADGVRSRSRGGARAGADGLAGAGRRAVSEHDPSGAEPEDVKEIANGNTLADISIRNHVFAWMLMAGLVGFGLHLLHRLRQRRQGPRRQPEPRRRLPRSSTSP